MCRILQKIRRPRLLLGVVALGTLVFLAVHALPSRHIRIAAGPRGGSFYETALQYKEILEGKGYRVEIVPFQNTDEIGAEVADPRQRLDIGFVAEDLNGKKSEKLMSLGDIQLQPIFIFENRQVAAIRPITSFADMRGMTLVLPPERSLTSRTLLSIFALSGISKQNTHIAFLPLDAGIARLQQGKFDAGLFILGADSKPMADLAMDPDLIMVEPDQQKAITKMLPYLREVHLPAGIFAFARNIPARDVDMLAATISVVARRDLPPPTTYAILEAMREVHRKSSYVNAAGEFPRYSGNVNQAESRVDDFYRNGTPWAYSHFSIAFASVIDTYLDWVLAFWVAMSALSVIAELEKVRFFATVACARGALWWVRRQRTSGAALSGRARAAIRMIEAGIAKEDHGIHTLLTELREAIEA